MTGAAAGPESGPGLEPVLEVAGVAKSYGATRALAGVTFTLEAGTFNVLLGPNGAGKSTLFQLLSGLFVPDAGAIALAGHDLARHPVRVLARLGIVFQQPTLDLDLSAAGNLKYHARLHGLTGSRARSRIDDALARLGLQKDAGRPCRQLSGGNRRKVELARALVHEPQVLLMDEPTVGLDPGSRRDLLGYVRGLCDGRGPSVLWATHLVDEAVGCDRLLVLHRGELVADGAPAALLAEHGAADVSGLFFELCGQQEKA